jgi:hypothetical protein
MMSQHWLIWTDIHQVVDELVATLRQTVHVYSRSFLGRANEPKNKSQLRTRVKLRRASEMPFRTVDWLIPDHLALEHLTILNGRRGLGKSLISQWIAARTTIGGPFMDDSRCDPADVVIVTARMTQKHPSSPD